MMSWLRIPTNLILSDSRETEAQVLCLCGEIGPTDSQQDSA